MASSAPKASFSNANRHMQEEEELRLTSVGVDIGSSTTHLVFSRIELTLEGSRYRVTRREVLNESEILLTPYVDDTRIDIADDGTATFNYKVTVTPNGYTDSGWTMGGAGAGRERLAGTVPSPLAGADLCAR